MFFHFLSFTFIFFHFLSFSYIFLHFLSSFIFFFFVGFFFVGCSKSDFFLGLNFVTISLDSSYVKKSILGSVSGSFLFFFQLSFFEVFKGFLHSPFQKISE